MQDRDKNIEFYEVQRMSKWAFLIIIAIQFIVIAIQFIYWICFERPLESMAKTIVPASITLGIAFLFLYLSKLATLIDEQGIYLRIFPSKVFYAWDDVENAYIRQLKFGEFGGWGSRSSLKYSFSFRPKNRAYIMSGSIGLQLELKNGERVLIGTHRQEEIEEILKKLGFGK
ncbi:MAG: hypothetical protein LBS52_01860 [Dysgonamonadaceae bacterium]|jgi:uncharacterized membrane protein (DUF485 family)|nr:hypothetical protein [Dysgonamonadaceae bacterium]